MTATKLNRILVPTDFSETATHALRYASGLARNLGAQITVLYSDPFVPPIDYTATVGSWSEDTFVLLKQRAEEQLRQTAEANIEAGVPWETKLRVSLPLEGILAQARESKAGLIVMGTHGRTGFRRLVLGSVTEAVMRQAEVPVIAVPPHATASPDINTIVCPVIFNDQCFDALTFTARIAPPSARFVIIRATPSDEVPAVADDVAELRAWLPDAIADRCELRMLGGGHVAEQTKGLAGTAHADLIVAAEPADRSAADALYGTFAARLAQRSDCPVLAVNAPAARAALHITEHEGTACAVR